MTTAVLIDEGFISEYFLWAAAKARATPSSQPLAGRFCFGFTMAPARCGDHSLSVFASRSLMAGAVQRPRRCACISESFLESEPKEAEIVLSSTCIRRGGSAGVG
eukprot:scaffold84996_cov35-Tisochrysis_lutea.AAC.1